MFDILNSWFSMALETVLGVGILVAIIKKGKQNWLLSQFKGKEFSFCPLLFSSYLYFSKLTLEDIKSTKCITKSNVVIC